MKKSDKMFFQRIGSCRQPLIKNAADMAKINALDTALWSINSLPVEAVNADVEFLSFLDTDKNGRIRPNEMRNALNWLFTVLQDCRNIDLKSDVVELDHLNINDSSGAKLRSAMLLILKNMRISDRQNLSLAELRNTSSIIGDGNSNGDGIVTVENTEDEDIKRTVSHIINCCGSKKDLSTLEGIDSGLLEQYISEANDFLANTATGVAIEMNSVYHEKAAELFQSYLKTEDRINEFFMLSGAVAGNGGSASENFADLNMFSISDLNEFIANAPIAALSKERKLSVADWVNPLYENDLREFFRLAFDAGAIADCNTLEYAEWCSIKNNFNDRKQWSAFKENPALAQIGIDDIKKDLNEENIAAIRDLIARDLAAKDAIDAVEQLKKLALFQKYMLDFVNNFVSLSELFDPNSLSMIQPGSLILDGRYFTLGVCVKNLAEHKKIIQRSNICVMYLDMATLNNNGSDKKIIAFAITSGTMRNIFIGKCGVFYAGDGTEYDAKVIDFVKQPVSFGEALLQPFYSLGEFMNKQADKFFSTRSKDVETVVNKQVDNAAKGNASQILETKNIQQTPAVSGSMLLMGGGVGLAALGSSVAFIAKSLKNVPFWHIVAVLFGIALTISAPVMLISIVKLLNRRISDFFSATGWAVNMQIPLTRKMGRLFTRKKHIPFGSTVHGNLLNILKYKDTDDK